MLVQCSICIAAYDKPRPLARVLESIYTQSPPFAFETIVVDDGSPIPLAKVCEPFPVHYVRIERPPGFRNPSRARNVAYRMAKGEVIIAQSDEVIHASERAIERLVGSLTPGRFVIATVFNVDKHGRTVFDKGIVQNQRGIAQYTGPATRRPFFFLGSLYRADLYAVGGNDEDFVEPCYDDDWFALCLTRGRQLDAYYAADIVGHHQHHAHFHDAPAIGRSRQIFDRKVAEATAGRALWQASGGPWDG
jgi:glycosyltransferase involved in cell wall biosynthesis